MEKPAKQAPVRPASKRAAPAKKTDATKKTTPKASPQAAVSAKAKIKKTAALKPAKVKKPKPVRDSFTIPKDEYEVLAQLKQRTVTLGQPGKKSELLRAGIKALAAMSDKSLLLAMKAVPPIKTGRPRKA